LFIPGKMGAAVGAYVFGPIADMSSLPTVMIVCAVISVIGAFVSEYYIDLSDDCVDDYKMIPEEDVGINSERPSGRNTLFS
jgi:hypothetical protein